MNIISQCQNIPDIHHTNVYRSYAEALAHVSFENKTADLLEDINLNQDEQGVTVMHNLIVY